MSGVIDDAKVLDDAPICRPVEHEIYGPLLVGGYRPFQGMMFGGGDFLPLAPSYFVSPE